jgi:hypothetical protein
MAPGVNDRCRGERERGFAGLRACRWNGDRIGCVVSVSGICEGGQGQGGDGQVKAETGRSRPIRAGQGGDGQGRESGGKRARPRKSQQSVSPRFSLSPREIGKQQQRVRIANYERWLGWERWRVVCMQLVGEQAKSPPALARDRPMRAAEIVGPGTYAASPCCLAFGR